MSTLLDVFELFRNEWDMILVSTSEHLFMSVTGVIIAILIGVPLAIWMTKNEKMALTIQTTINIIQTIPSLALLLMIMTFFGLGYTTAILALVCYSFLPIVQNTYSGLQNVDEHLIEAGKGMGMTPFQLLLKVKIPLAMPVMMAGFRIATVVSIGVATIATFVGAGGLGSVIFRGILSTDDVRILAGSIPAAFLAVSFDFLLKWAEKRSGVHLYKARNH